jgi:hypothetical protein
MKTIKLKVTVQVPDNYEIDEPEWLLSDAVDYRKPEIEIESVIKISE